MVEASRAVAGLDLLGELLELLGERGAEALELGGLLAVLGEAELGGELVLVEQVLLGALRGLHRLDLERAVVAQAGGGRDQLADDHVLLQADELVSLALQRGVGEHLGRLLEGGGRQERLGGQRGLGDPEDHLLALGRRAAVVLDLLVEDLELVPVLERAGQQRGRALGVDPHPLQHLAGDQLDVLVVDVDALGLVDLLDLLRRGRARSPSGRGSAAGRRGTATPPRAASPASTLSPCLTSRRARGWSLYACSSPLASVIVTRISLSVSSIATLPSTSAISAMPFGLRASNSSTTRGRPWVMSSAGDTAGVEGAHGQLGAGLADRLGGDDADRVAELDHRAGGERAAVAGLADAGLELALEHRAHRDRRPPRRRTPRRSPRARAGRSPGRA